MFTAEAAGLRWLKAAGGVAVVDVIEHSEHTIVLERLRTIPPTKHAAQAFGEALVMTHDGGADAFGCAPAGFSGQSFISDLKMSTEPMPRWGSFFAAQRILAYANPAQLGRDGMTVIEAVAARLDAGVFDDDASPARLHGDLWSGNVLFTENGVTLIDPSAHGGHRISDLAMLSLFGAPHLQVILEAYERSSAHLPANWRDLISLHQIYPLLIHAVLFGGHYPDSAVKLAKKYL